MSLFVCRGKVSESVVSQFGDSLSFLTRHSRAGGEVHSRLKCNTGSSISEGFEWGQEVEAFTRGVVVAMDASLEIVRGQRGEIGFTGQVAAQATDGVFDAALLPGFVGVAEEGGNTQALGELVMGGELGAVIEGDGLTQGRRQRCEPLQEVIDDGLGGLIGLAGEAQRARGAFLNQVVRHKVFYEWGSQEKYSTADWPPDWVSWLPAPSVYTIERPSPRCCRWGRRVRSARGSNSGESLPFHASAGITDAGS